jgi:hypothetical protein
MTLEAYKKECAQMLDSVSRQAGDQGEPLRLMFMQVLYELAATVPFEEREPFFDHWWSLPVDDRLKREVLRKSKAGKGVQ